MNNNNEENTLTFGRIFHYLKKALPAILISMIIVVFVGVLVLTLGRETTVKAETQAIIELTYSGADKGFDVDGNKFDKNSLIGIDKIGAALNILGLSNKYSATDIKNAIKVSPRYSEKIDNLLNNVKDAEELLKILDGANLIPTSYKLSFDYNSVENMTKEDSVNIISEIISINKDAVFEKLANKNNISENVTEEEYISKYNNIEFFTIMESHINEIYNCLYSFNSAGYMANVINKVDIIRSKNNDFYSYIVDNKILSDAEKESVLRKYKNESDSLKAEIDSIDGSIKSIQEAIEAIKITIVTSDKEINTSVESEAQKILSEELIKYVSQKNTKIARNQVLEKRIAEISTLTSMPTTEQAKIIADKKEIILNDIRNVTDTAKEKIAAYATAGSADNGFKTVLAPVTVENTKVSSVNWLLYIVMFLVIGFAAGIIMNTVINSIYKNVKGGKIKTDNTSDAADISVDDKK